MGLGACCSAEKVFLYANVALAMYAGVILATAARLTLDPSTYAWSRLMCELQYRVTRAHLYCTGAFLCALVYVGVSAVFPPAKIKLLIYFFGTLVLMASEAAFGAWLWWSLRAWWESSPQAELVRSGLELQEDVKKLLSILEKHHQIVEEVNNTMHEVERDMSGNACIILACLVVSVVLQVLSLVLSWLLQRRAGAEAAKTEPSESWGRSNRYMYSTVAQETKRHSEDLTNGLNDRIQT